MGSLVLLSSDGTWKVPLAIPTSCVHSNGVQLKHSKQRELRHTSSGMKLSSIFCRWAPLRNFIFDRVAGDMNGETTRQRPAAPAEDICPFSWHRPACSLRSGLPVCEHEYAKGSKCCE